MAKGPYRNVWSSVALTIAFTSWSACLQAEVAAIVTDAAGVSAQSGAAKGAVNILTEVDVGTRLQLGKGGRLVVIYVKSGEEFSMNGPARIEFKANEPVAVNGPVPVKRINPLSKATASVQVKASGVTQGAVFMRGAQPTDPIKLLNLAGTKTLETTLEFHWQAVESAVKYQFELIDADGNQLFRTAVDGTTLKLPANVPVQPGVEYSWTVTTRLNDGRRYAGSGDFSLAGEELRGQFESLRPAANARVSERVAFAAWLAQAELRDEARKYWKALALERPKDPRVKQLAGD